VRFRWLDKPFLEATRSAVDAEAAQELQRLQDDPTDPERGVRIARLIACPQPLRWLLLNWYHRVGWAGRQVVLEATVRRYYRIRHLENLTFSGRDDLQWCTAEYDEPDGVVHLLLAYCPINELGRLLTSIDESLMMQPSDRRLVVDLHVWYPEDLPTAELADEEIRSRAAAAERQAQYRLSITISEPDRDGVRGRTYHFTYRVAGASIAEDEFFRNLHPMLAERLDLWRLSNFVLERLDSVEDVYLFRGVALANPKDERLFALAEVRDITPVVDAEGRVTALPLMERMYLEALSGIRRYQSHRPEAQRLLQNQVILYVRPAWTVPPSLWEELAERQAVASRGLGIEEVIARVRIPTSGGKLRQQELHVTSPAGGVVVRQTAPEHSPVPVLSEFEWRALQTRRRGSHYPYDVIRMLTPRSSSRSVFPSGDFLEYDLVTDDGGNSRLQPVVRAPGGNTCNIVVGVLRNVTAEYPEGMARVALFGDPSRGMGNLAEAECRRIIAACDLAQAMRVPVEWFAVSAGAKIAMSSGTENMDWIAAVLRRLIEFTQGGGEINVIVTGINVGAQPYWNAEATMLMHTRGILVMIPESAMVLTGKTALDFSGGVSAEDNLGIGGYERIMGPNGQAQYYAPDLEAACQILFRHYAHTYVLSGERFPRRTTTTDPVDRDVRGFRHSRDAGSEFRTVGEIFAPETNVDRKKPFDIRSVMRAVTDADAEPLERWKSMRDADTVVVWDARIGGIPICLLGIESRPIAREGMLPADGPEAWTSGTLFPQSSRKTARAVNAASGNRPLVVLANLSGFDGSPESMRKLQLEYGAEIGRAVTNFRGPIVFVVISRYHGGAFVVFSKRLNPDLEVAAVEGSYASVIGGAPAAAVVFTRDVDHRTRADERVSELAKQAADAAPADAERLRAQLAAVTAAVRAEKLGEVAAEFEHIHTIERARQMGSVDQIIPAQDLRPYLVDALERGIARELERAERSPVSAAEVASGELLLGH
jgi:acetyl-CoA carboxylase carboxyltransferase component